MNTKVKLRVCPADAGFWMEAILPDDCMTHLWKCIDDGKKAAITHKQELAGNISQSYTLIDRDDLFTNNILFPFIDDYSKKNGGHPHRIPAIPGKEGLTPSIKLTHMWVNYQYKHEFNPPHRHGGLYSFVVWMKVPYTFEEECKQSFLKDTKEVEKKPGGFELQYCDFLGNPRSTFYPMSPEMEGHMLLFPAGLTHQVFPFYTSDEQRVSISGNVWTVYE